MARLFLFLFLSTLAGTAAAQLVIQAVSAASQPQMGRDEVGFSSCGVRAVVVTNEGEYVDAYDFSLMVRADMAYGLLKAGKTRTSMSSAKRGEYSKQPTGDRPVRFWIAQESEGKAIAPKTIMPAETKGYILELAELLPTLTGIAAIISGERMQFAIRYEEQEFDTVISFSAAMDENERAPLWKCLKGVGERISSQGDSKG